MASEIKAGIGHGGGHAEGEGVITSVGGTPASITVTFDGKDQTFWVVAGTRIRVDGHAAILSDLKVGMKVEVKYLVATMTAIEIDARRR